jgi:hypothetical protein
VTTFHKQGYELYGKKMIQSFLKNWPKEINLYVYHQDVIPSERGENLILLDLESSCPDLVKFKNKWKDDPNARGNVSDSSAYIRLEKREKVGFKWDAIRFSHKVYAIFHCAKNCDADVLFWMDADTICHSPIPFDFIQSMSSSTVDLGFLGRENKYSECGLYSMNLKSNVVQDFLKKFQWVYDNAEQGIFTFSEWHDSFVFDRVREMIPSMREFNWSKGLIKGEGHPLINSSWGAYLDHLKGKRKIAGKSEKIDLKVNRTEDYWR